MGIFKNGLINWKTLLVGVITFLIMNFSDWVGLALTPEQKNTILSFAVMVIAWFVKDSDVTGVQ